MTQLTTSQLLSVAIENLVATKNETGHRTLRVAAAAFVYAYDLANNDKRPNAYGLALDAVKVELNKLAETEDGTGAATVKLIRAWVGKAYVKYAPIANAAGNTSDGFDPQAATDAVLAHFGNRSWRVVAGEFRAPQDPNKLPTQRTKQAPVNSVDPQPAPAPEATEVNDVNPAVLVEAPEPAPEATEVNDVNPAVLVEAPEPADCTEQFLAYAAHGMDDERILEVIKALTVILEQRGQDATDTVLKSA